MSRIIIISQLKDGGSEHSETLLMVKIQCDCPHVLDETSFIVNSIGVAYLMVSKRLTHVDRFKSFIF